MIKLGLGMMGIGATSFGLLFSLLGPFGTCATGGQVAS